jgi:hypothetical protein
VKVVENLLVLALPLQHQLLANPLTLELPPLLPPLLLQHRKLPLELLQHRKLPLELLQHRELPPLLLQLQLPNYS